MGGEDAAGENTATEKPEGCSCNKSGCCSGVVGLCLMAFVMFVFGCGLIQLGSFIDVPSLVIIGGAMVGGWLIAHGWRGSWRAVKILAVNRAANMGDARLAKDFCANGIWTALLAGALGTVIGAINILAGGFDLQMESSKLLTLITSSAAVCILTFFWSWIVAIVLVPFYYRARALENAGEK